MLVAVVAGTRVGYALVLGDGITITSPADRTPSPDGCDDSQRTNGVPGFTLVELAVAPGHRRLGYGSALLEAVLALGGPRGVRLTVRADDQRARRFYAQHGFRVQKRLPEYYGDDPGLVLVRDGSDDVSTAGGADG